jgi:hypothetical protein
VGPALDENFLVVGYTYNLAVDTQNHVNEYCPRQTSFWRDTPGSIAS